jgi:TonB-dependent receptor
MSKHAFKYLLILYAFLFFSGNIYAQSGALRGTVTDENGVAVPGATIQVENIARGTISDANGNYQLLNVPVGKQKIVISFIGYSTEVKVVEITPRSINVLDVKMEAEAVEIASVVIYGQAQGQQAAINQQLNAPGIVNIVSGQKLRELPDVNVAESLGRLPGLMADRSRGEGNSITIRGLAPQYNSIAVGGNNLPSTSDNRGTSLSMITNEILGGVEVLKANTADKDAEGLGGTVNLTLKEAPSAFSAKAEIESGYNTLMSTFNKYRASTFVSNRFLNNKLGLMWTANYDNDRRESDAFSASYGIGTFGVMELSNAAIEANIQDRNRTGTSLLLDWNIHPSTTIKSSNFFTYQNSTTYDRNKSIGSTIDYAQEQSTRYGFMLSNAIGVEHFFLGTMLDWGVSRSQNKEEMPYHNQLSFRKEGNVFYPGVNPGSTGILEDVRQNEDVIVRTQDPLNNGRYSIFNPEFLNDDINHYYLNRGRSRPNISGETEMSAYLNWEIPFNIGNSISGYVKLGSKLRYKERYSERKESDAKFVHNEGDAGYISTDSYMLAYPDLILQGDVQEGAAFPGQISILNYLDYNYEPRDFMNGRYIYLHLDNVLDYDLMYEHYQNALDTIYNNRIDAARDDYTAQERIWANYAMAEINFGKYVTFIPGVRFEETYINYSGNQSILGVSQEDLEEELGRDAEVYDLFSEVYADNSYLNVLPQIHLKIKPFNWFDVRLAYTNTISRPSYSELSPKLSLRPVKIGYEVRKGDTKLNPALSRNLDLIMTFYTQKVGLITVGLFRKDIEGFIYGRTSRIIADTPMDVENFGLPEEVTSKINKGKIDYVLNNPNDAYVIGLEFDVQSNMQFLPIKGFVFNFNFTMMQSELGYNFVYQLDKQVGIDPVTFQPIFEFNDVDTVLFDRMLKQPGYLANIGIGYDNARIGLSTRLSFSYQDDILTNEPAALDDRNLRITDAYYRVDFQGIQRLYNRLSLLLNISNVFNQPDRAVQVANGFNTKVESYGANYRVGLRYRF